MAVIVEDIRVARGWSQGELANAVGYSQSWVSRVINGQQSLTVEQVRDLADRLEIPLHLLRFASATETRKGASPTRRRDFGKVIATAALSLPTACTGDDIDEGTAPTLRAITGGQRLLDASSPARELAPGAIAHVDLTERVLKRAQRTPHVPEIAAGASEAAGFAAWLHTDMGDLGSARSYYQTAIGHARQAGHQLLEVYMLGSLASFEIEAEDPQLGLTLAAEARRRMGTDAHPTAKAWLSCVRSLAYASLGDSSACSHEIARAEANVVRQENAAPPWPWVFSFDDAKVASHRALAGVRLRHPKEARAAFSEALHGSTTNAKQAALLKVELASAHADSGDVDEAFRLASEALRTGTQFRSERVITRVRRFRRGYRGAHARVVNELDEQLTDVLTGQRSK